MECEETGLGGVLRKANLHPHQVLFSNAKFTWGQPGANSSKESLFVLNVHTLQVLKGSLVAVIGDVGSGKSSLVSAIMGNLQLNSGVVSIPNHCCN